jgi:hypothetical protein
MVKIVKKCVINRTTTVKRLHNDSRFSNTTEALSLQARVALRKVARVIDTAIKRK